MPVESQQSKKFDTVNNAGGSGGREAERLRVKRRMRHLYDRVAKGTIAVGGVGVIATLLLIFLYLFYEVLPLFGKAGVEAVSEYRIAQFAQSQALHRAINEQAQSAMRLDDSGSATFFDLIDGRISAEIELLTNSDAAVSSFALDSQQTGIFALGLADGEVIVAQYSWENEFEPGLNTRTQVPLVTYPFGTDRFVLFENEAVDSLAIRTAGESLSLVGMTRDGAASLYSEDRRENLFAEFDLAGFDIPAEVRSRNLRLNVGQSQKLFIDNDRRWLFVVNPIGVARLIDLPAALSGETAEFVDQIELVAGDRVPTRVEFLLGGVSLLVADDSGEVSQWFFVRDGNRPGLRKIRSFSLGDQPITALTVEQRRKNIVIGDAAGRVAIYGTTSESAVFLDGRSAGEPQGIAVSPRGDALLIETPAGQISIWSVNNRHPEVSFSSLWNRVWYESYPQPDYVWQSSSASDEFEPKYSLAPLSFGTLKAAFYAMLFAAPMAVCGAVFTGYFMAPAMRRKIKPLVEMMEALPTVVLGFLAGLWLAPFVETNLLGIFSLLILLPLGILLASFCWLQLPGLVRSLIPEGWEAALLIPVIALIALASFHVATPLESLFFSGDMRAWVSDELGISYDQRNALVVGFAMGFAVIPTIYSIAEDAIFTVPRHLSDGSRALGATSWQSLYRVVLPTASPGIFSALMIGMGRAVGETMIVLMATGNTPIMDANIFEGMRTLAANIAIEVPESEVGGTHYRILFLTALVLFLFTFVVNTIAEVVRQRLRNKYSTI